MCPDLSSGSVHRREASVAPTCGWPFLPSRAHIAVGGAQVERMARGGAPNGNDLLRARADLRMPHRLNPDVEPRFGPTQRSDACRSNWQERRVPLACEDAERDRLARTGPHVRPCER
jgi:hypothetical protein